MAFCCLGLYLARKLAPWSAFAEFGLTAPIGKGLLFGFVATVPMFAGGCLLGTWTTSETGLSLLFGAGIWPLGEEILFRGYTFRQLHRRAGWNLWVAAITTGLVFGAVHLANASVQQLPLGPQVGTAAIIVLGGVLYAWIFARWNDNLWTVWALHGLMNLWWSLFNLSENPMGGWGPNLLRLLTIILAVGITIRFAPRR